MIQCKILKNLIVPCSYLKSQSTNIEQVIVPDINENEFELLLNLGFRNFGKYFFRPNCPNCYECIPIRIDVNNFSQTKSQKRTLNKAKDFNYIVDEECDYKQAFDIFSEHGKRFQSNKTQNFELFINSFFSEFKYSSNIQIKDNNKLIAVNHYDKTSNQISAIYNYYLPEYQSFSLGKVSILNGIKLCQTKNIGYLYLGNYIKNYKHMEYKADYYPSEILLSENNWKPFYSINKEQQIEAPKFIIEQSIQDLIGVYLEPSNN